MYSKQWLEIGKKEGLKPLTQKGKGVILRMRAELTRVEEVIRQSKKVAMGNQELNEYSYWLRNAYWSHDQSNSGGTHSGPQQIVDNKGKLDYTLAALLLIYNERHSKCFCRNLTTIKRIDWYIR